MSQPPTRTRILRAVIGLALLGLAGVAVWWFALRRPPPPTGLQLVVAVRATGPIAVDGRLDEPDWSRASATIPFMMSHGRAWAPLECTARLLWDDDALYVGFEVVDHDIISPMKGRRDQELWTRDVVEVFIDPDGDGRWYYEFQTNPRAALFDARFPAHRQNLKRSMAWNARGLASGLVVRGIPDDGQPDEGYTAELRIPLSAIDRPPQRPIVGSVWRINLFRIDIHDDGSGHYTAWTPPIVGDFHALDRFGFLVFGE